MQTMPTDPTQQQAAPMPQGPHRITAADTPGQAYVPGQAAAAAPVAEAVAVEVVPLSPAELEQIQAKRAARINRLDQIGQTLCQYRDEAIAYRSDFEREWVEAHRQYDVGEVTDYSQRGTREFPPDSTSNDADYRKTRDNITRPAVLMVTSRVSDMLFPTSDRNWDLTASPDAEVPKSILQVEVERILQGMQPEPQIDPETQQPMPAERVTWESLSYDQQQSIEQRVADIRVSRMRARIDDQLQESSYAAHGRDTIGDGVLYGTGVIKGPFARRRRARVYDENTGSWVSRYIEEPAPTASYVDLFSFYPRPARRVKECPGVFQLHLYTDELLRKLVHQPGFDRGQVARALRDENRVPGALSASILYQMGVTSRSGSTASLLDSRYPVWEYHGTLPKQGVADFVAGMLEQKSVSPDIASAIIGELDDDPMVEVNCECWMVNGIVLKLALEPVRDLSTIYHVYNYEERPDTIFGKGVPAVMRDDQMATTQLWQAMMLNAMMSAGLQLGVVKQWLTPVGPNGGSHDLTLSRPRVWSFTDEVKDIRQAITAFQVPSVLDKLMPLYERSKKNSEEHIVLPSIVQGDPTNAVPTSSGLAMLMNAGNIVTRRLAKCWDDNVTAPLIGGFFEWNMDHGPDDIKGDYIVVPRGSSHLLVKDVQSQRFLFALQTYSQHPKLEGMMKWEEWGRQGLIVMDMDAQRLLYGDDELRQREKALAANPPPPDPQAMVAQARVKEAETRAAVAEAGAQRAQAQTEREARRDEMDMQSHRDELAARLQIAQLNATTALAKLDKDERIQLQAMMQKGEFEGLWARMEAARLAQTDRRDQLQIAVESPDPRLA